MGTTNFERRGNNGHPFEALAKIPQEVKDFMNKALYELERGKSNGVIDRLTDNTGKNWKISLGKLKKSLYSTATITIIFYLENKEIEQGNYEEVYRKDLRENT